jgi:hypothetical protein
VLLLVTGVAVEHDTGDALLGGGGEAGHGSGHDGGTLGVTAGNDNGVGALGGGQVEETLGLAVGCLGGAIGQSVLAYTGGVRFSDTLAGDVVRICLLETLTGGWADSDALSIVISQDSQDVNSRSSYDVTRLRRTTSEDESDLLALTV